MRHTPRINGLNIRLKRAGESGERACCVASWSDLVDKTRIAARHSPHQAAFGRRWPSMPAWFLIALRLRVAVRTAAAGAATELARARDHDKAALYSYSYVKPAR